MRMGRLTAVGLVAALTLVWLPPAEAAPTHVDWTKYQASPNNQGFNPFERTVTPSNVRFLSLKYIGVMNPLQESLIDKSAPAVVGDVAYIGSFDGNLYAFPATGCGAAHCQPLWKGHTDNGIYSSPAVVNGVVYVGSSDHKLYAFPAAGCGASMCAPLWTGATTQGILSSAPVVAGGLVLVGSFDGRLYAFAQAGCGQATCQPVWVGPTGDDHIASSPAVAGTTVFVTSYDDFSTVGNLRAFNLAGCGQAVCSALWTAPLSGGVIDAGPAVANGFVYLPSFIDGRLEVFDAAGCGQAMCGPVWTAPGENYADATPAIARGVVYLTGGDGTLFAYDATGCGQAECQPLWTGFAGGTQAAYVSPPIVAGGVVYTTKNNAHVFAWRASGCNRSTCSPLWSAQTEGQIVSAGPVMVNGRLYVGSERAGSPTDQGRLYVYTLNGQE